MINEGYHLQANGIRLARLENNEQTSEHAHLISFRAL